MATFKLIIINIMAKKQIKLGACFILFFVFLWPNPSPIFAQDPILHTVAPGDTWLALRYRYQLPIEALQMANPHINPQRQPTIGTTIQIPNVGQKEVTGRLLRPYSPNILQTAIATKQTPWGLALRNEISSPYTPLFYRPLLIPDDTAVPQEFPINFNTLELSQTIPQPGQAVGLRGIVAEDVQFTAVLDGNEMDLFTNGNYLVALTGVGAFFGSGQPELTIQADDGPLWSQPWQFQDANEWIYQEITLTGSAAEIDQESIRQERLRLMEIWHTDTAVPQWQSTFQEPLNNYLDITSPYGARRSYNGGPYRTYHEGIDYSAYGGTAVLAPAAGTVVLAEELYVRGYAVIIDHGMGVYSGYYHQSKINVNVGDIVQQGQQIGEVGTSGLSTGNHLHWDLLVNGIWVDGQAWRTQNMSCWILEGMGSPCVKESAVGD